MNNIYFRAYVIIAFCYIVRTEARMVKSREEALAERYINKDDADRMQRELANRGDGYGTDWIYMPDGDGNPQVAILSHDDNRGKWFWSEDEGRDDAGNTQNATNDVNLFLYTRANPMEGQMIAADNPESIKVSHFDSKKPTKVIIHGWKSSGDSSTVLNIKNAYLKRSDVNVVGVDWSNIAQTSYYFTPMGETSNVGEQVARLIDTMVSTQGARHQDFHIIGHSLGAHVAGAAGSRSGGRISRVTGLDPALPGFQYWQGPEGRLDDTDAEFVEVIHTCSGALGMSSPAGHADFYPNGGSPFQPGCCCLPEFTEACSHGRAHHYFAESIINDVPFEASSCSTWDHFKRGLCGPTSAIMGERTDTTARGVYYLVTNDTAPYALGHTGARYPQDEE